MNLCYVRNIDLLIDIRDGICNIYFIHLARIYNRDKLGDSISGYVNENSVFVRSSRYVNKKI